MGSPFFGSRPAYVVSEQYLPIHLRNVHHIISDALVSDHIPHITSQPLSKRRYIRTNNANSSYTSPLFIFPPHSPPQHRYQLSFPDDIASVSCPVNDCPANPVTRERLREHFSRWHPFDSIQVQQEGILPQCRCCGRYLTTITPSHYTSKSCTS